MRRPRWTTIYIKRVPHQQDPIGDRLIWPPPKWKPERPHLTFILAEVPCKELSAPKVRNARMSALVGREDSRGERRETSGAFFVNFDFTHRMPSLLPPSP